jgi:hexaprenyl-diphosphate synthase
VSKIQDTVSDILPGRGPLKGGDNVTVDPFKVVGRELKFLNKHLRQLLGSGHPLLDTVAKYYTQSEGKHVRPLLVLLMSRATALGPKSSRPSTNETDVNIGIDTPISSSNVLYDNNPDQPASSMLQPSPTEPFFPNDTSILPSQRRLAEITELIHTASLLHDDVLDTSTTRRSAPSANIAFGNKMAVLAGDFLLGRASVALARLRDPEVIELLATVIANLVEGEFMQLKNTRVSESKPTYSEDVLSYYLQKTYLKSASLISKSCRAAALLGQCAPSVVEAAYAYGRNLGLAFQLVDDMLDYTVSQEELGKPANADLELGLATAPLLFAWKERPELGELVGRRFEGDGDVTQVSPRQLTWVTGLGLMVTQARSIVLSTSAIAQTRALAQDYADKAVSSIREFPDGEAKDGLEEMCVKVMKRRK